MNRKTIQKCKLNENFLHFLFFLSKIEHKKLIYKYHSFFCKPNVIDNKFNLITPNFSIVVNPRNILS